MLFSWRQHTKYRKKPVLVEAYRTKGPRGNAGYSYAKKWRTECRKKQNGLSRTCITIRPAKDEISAVTAEDVYVVWFCKTLQNWKALLSTDLPDGMYFEVTYNGDKKEAYLDAYKKIRNVKISD